MKLNLYQVDAFTDKLFGGNPAAVVPLKQWIDDELMQKIALENNLSETAFIVPAKKSSKTQGDKDFNGNGTADYEIRWFTPTVEMDLCGHATLGSAYVLFNILDYKKKEIKFSSRSGILKVKKDGKKIWLNFPSWRPERVIEPPQELQQGIGGAEIAGVYKHRDLLVELRDEEAVKNCKPDFTILKKIGDMVIITAPGNEVDFVSRFFGPSAGVDEDPATGSAHSQLIPFWSERLKKQKLASIQLSQRGAAFSCEYKGDRVLMGGTCVYYMEGEIKLPKN